MPINTLTFAETFTGELDKVYVQETAVGFMMDGAMRAKFVGAKTVKIPNVSLQGLADYDRDTGFIRGAVTVANEAFTMQQDRARSFQIDREDLDETGVASLAGEVISEFVRTKVVPETDAYTISKLAGLANTRGQLLQGGNIATPYAAFSALLASVQAAAGYNEELVCFINPYTYNLFKASSELTRMLVPSDFKQGDVSFKVNKIDGVSLIPVTNDRMQTAYTFLDGGTGNEEGGFTPTTSAKGIYMLMLPKKAASVVKKSEKIRTFSPDQNISADAYKFDYRIYYDVFVKTSKAPTVWAWVAPTITISSNVAATTTKVAGSISGTLSVTAAASDSSTLAYQWYSATSALKADATILAGKTSASFTIPTTLTAGEYFYFVKITAGGSTVQDSAVGKVTITAE